VLGHGSDGAQLRTSCAKLGQLQGQRLSALELLYSGFFNGNPVEIGDQSGMRNEKGSSDLFGSHLFEKVGRLALAYVEQLGYGSTVKSK
jgi:hypothetical protein